MKIIIANDHAAVEFKILLIDWLHRKGNEVVNLGVEMGEKADYPAMAEKAVKEFRKGGYDAGILCCGTGIGISIAANKMTGIRCALPQNVFAARAAKKHNDCQFIALGSRVEYSDNVTDIISTFLDSNFSAGRHKHRVKMIHNLEARSLSKKK